MIADALPDSQFVVVPDAGHMAMMEDPGMVNEALRGLLRAAAEHAGITTGGRAKRA